MKTNTTMMIVAGLLTISILLLSCSKDDLGDADELVSYDDCDALYRVRAGNTLWVITAMQIEGDDTLTLIGYDRIVQNTGTANVNWVIYKKECQ